MIEWLFEPSTITGLVSLVVLEIILGIDNLIFIAILADKLPPNQRDKARIIGLSIALFMRIGLLLSISWIMSLTKPWIQVLGKSFSWKDIILLGGGFFLVFKATTELHNRIEGVAKAEDSDKKNVSVSKVGFWAIIFQIILLDAVFSLDSIIVAVGMVEDVVIMIIAIIISIIIMLLSSKPLMLFINAHQTIVILCLGFLLMVGCSLIADGMGFHIPKGYLYASMSFALLIECINHVSRSKKKRRG
ncbi:MAG: TerC family protein [Pseudomonadota bacterium]